MKVRYVFFSSILFFGCSLILLAQKTNTEGSRQIHLDFHTSEYIKGIGEEFDKKQFQNALIAGNVNSINVFAKGHHGWCYYPSKAGAIHPNLKFDLLKEQIDACHEIGVRVQAYITVGWSVKDAREHPEWRCLTKKGEAFSHDGKNLSDFDTSEGLPFTWWELLSPEGAYLDLILAQTKEVCKNYDLDGIWFDIIPVENINYSESSLADMKAKGIDVKDHEAANEYHVEKMKVFFEKTTDVVKKYLPDASLFYNWTTAMNYKNAIKYDLYKYNTKQDLEDLPTTWGGYDVFPMRAKFFNNTGKPIVAMSGKFHTAWGEFGGFKHKDAILYETASMLAFGARANIGDQLHPSGIMEMETYKNIGFAFDYVEKIEEYSLNGTDVANLGVWLSLSKENDEGTVKMLLENQLDFLVINNLDDWSGIETIILNSGTHLNETDTKRIQKFLDKGGKLLVMGNGTLDEQKGEFAFDLGVKYLGPAEFDIDFTMVKDELAENLPKSPFLNYSAAIRVEPLRGAKVLARIREPYFSRTIEHFTSHRNTPYKLQDATHPAVVEHGNTVYVAHDLGKQYFETGARVHRDLFYNALKTIHPESMLEVDLPSAARVNLLHQPDKKRYVAHLLYATPMKRGAAEIIEDLIPIFDITTTIRVPEKISKVYTIPDNPDNNELDFELINGDVKVTVPKLKCHQAVVFEY